MKYGSNNSYAGVVIMQIVPNPEEAAHLGKSASISAYALLILETLLTYLENDWDFGALGAGVEGDS